MTSVLSTNIISPLGMTVEQNWQALMAGRSALSRHEEWNGIPESFTASGFSSEQRRSLMVEGCTFFESVSIHSIMSAASDCSADLSSERTILILCTTKADVGELSADTSSDAEYLAPGAAAKKIALRCGFVTEPVVVCNACISGALGQLLAFRLIESGDYDAAVVCGVDCLTPFIVTGFMSFKALSPEPCRPFDIERLGLNLGEAAATIVLGRSDNAAEDAWKLISGSADNDAYHVSAPAPDGNGTLRVMKQALEGFDPERLALICAHGTATMFNDQMESKAIAGAGLGHIPVTAVKGWYGHTLGAAGILETIIMMRSLDEGIILPVRGFEELGVSGKVNVSSSPRTTDKNSFLKIISGFGGCNGALLFSKDSSSGAPASDERLAVEAHSVRITQDSLVLDGKAVDLSSTGKALLTEIYKTRLEAYPKFYKMDVFSRLVFLATELLMQKAPQCADEKKSLILFNRNSSIVADRNHLATISDPENFFPSPSVFLYTLPNVVTGEIALKHALKGETSLYILEQRNDGLMKQITASTLAFGGSDCMVCGWVDCSDEDTFEADLKLIIR